MEGSSPDQADWLNAVDFSADGRWLVTGSNDGRVRVWLAERHNERPVAELLGHRGGVRDVRFHPRDPWVVASAASDGTARTWRVPERTVLPGDGGWILDADVSRDGRYVVTAEDNLGWLRVWRTDSGALEKELSRGYDGWLQTVAFTPDGNTVVAASSRAFAPTVWAWRGQQQSVALDDNDWVITGVAVRHDGRTVAGGDYRNRVVLWDLATRKITSRLTGGRDDYFVFDVAFIPGSSLVAAGSTDGTVRIWDPSRSNRPLRTLGSLGWAAIQAVDVSPDGRYLATAVEDYSIRVWRVADGRLVAEIQGPRSTITDVAFSPEGSRLVVSAAGRCGPRLALAGRPQAGRAAPSRQRRGRRQVPRRRQAPRVGQ